MLNLTASFHIRLVFSQLLPETGIQVIDVGRKCLSLYKLRRREILRKYNGFIMILAKKCLHSMKRKMTIKFENYIVEKVSLLLFNFKCTGCDIVFALESFVATCLKLLLLLFAYLTFMPSVVRNRYTFFLRLNSSSFYRCWTWPRPFISVWCSLNFFHQHWCGKKCISTIQVTKKINSKRI